jgi:hypothetical protein
MTSKTANKFSPEVGGRAVRRPYVPHDRILAVPESALRATLALLQQAGSRIAIGPAVQSTRPPAWRTWGRRIEGNLAKASSIRLELLKDVRSPLPAGPMAVHMARRLPSFRNWVGLWKPTGDATGPVIYESRFPSKEFHPDDDSNNQSHAASLCG